MVGCPPVGDSSFDHSAKVGTDRSLYYFLNKYLIE